MINAVEYNDIERTFNSPYINWDFYKNSTVLITGVTGLIGSFIANVFLRANEVKNTDIKIIGLVRNKKKAQKMFPDYKKQGMKFIVQDIGKEIKYSGDVDIIIHCANSTSSKSFTENPAGTINSIVDGTKNILEFAKSKKVKSVVYLSSMEVFGDIPFEREERLQEDDYGYIDILKPRSSYPVGKKCAESLCAAYYNEYKVPVKTARLVQTIGSGVDYNDARMFAEFARCIVENRDIVLKTEGKTIRSYIYITDAVSAILCMAEKGQNGESYNISNPDTTCSVKQIAEMLCNKYPNSELKIELDPNNNYYLKPIKYYVDNKKFSELTLWKPEISLEQAFINLINGFCWVKYKNQNQLTYKKSGFLKNIFSITNIGNYKVITVLGLTFKLSRAKLSKHLFDCEINNKKILFCNPKGGLYGCNPKYITEEILNRNLPYELVWLNNSPEGEESFPNKVKVVPFNSEQALKELASAKIWIDNQRKLFHITRGLEKKSDQVYIQTWHGSLGIKKIGMDSPMIKVGTSWIPDGIKDAVMTDYLISNSDFENKVYENNFWNNGKILKYGHARNDVFFKTKEEQEQIKKRVCEKLGIETNKKIFLYAPSFRDDYRTDCYNIDIERIKSTLEEKFGGSWCAIVRLHPRMCLRGVNNIIRFNEFTVNANSYPDIQDILVASDVAFTDYSSWIFDFMLSKKPAFIYAEDIEAFNNETGFYYPLETTPFPIAKNNEELVSNVLHFDYDKYKVEVDKFLKDKGCIEDGNASKRVVDLIESIINNG